MTCAMKRSKYKACCLNLMFLISISDSDVTRIYHFMPYMSTWSDIWRLFINSLCMDNDQQRKKSLTTQMNKHIIFSIKAIL
jgi:hypothetical protein